MNALFLVAAEEIPPRLLDADQFGAVTVYLAVIVFLLGLIAVGVFRRG